MSNTPDPALQATVTRYTLTKLQRIQVLIPLGALASTAASRMPGILTLSIGLAVMLAYWLALRGAASPRRSHGAAAARVSEGSIALRWHYGRWDCGNDLRFRCRLHRAGDRRRPFNALRVWRIRGAVVATRCHVTRQPSWLAGG
jgi:hypothetical protein